MPRLPRIRIWPKPKPKKGGDVTAQDSVPYPAGWDEFLRQGVVRAPHPRGRAEDCTCPTVWMSVLPPPPCPAHGQMQMYTVTC